MKIKAYIRRKLNRLLYDSDYSPGAFGAIGPHCKIGSECVLVPKNMFLEDYVIVQNRVNFISSEGKLVVKKYSVISSGCIIVPGTHLSAPGIPFYYQALRHYGDRHNTITIGEDCWVGAGSTLLCKSGLGRGCVVAAGSVVTKEFPPYAVIAGVPARIVGVKLSKADIITHESCIYPESERFSESELDILFDTYYKDMKPMEKCDGKEIIRFQSDYAVLM